MRLKSKPRKRAAAFSFLWVVDPWETLDHASDTTLRLAEEAFLQGHSSFIGEIQTLARHNSKTTILAREICGFTRATLAGKSHVEFDFEAEQPKEIKFFSQIHYRVDPPIDQKYFHGLQLLCTGTSASRIVNSPQALTLLSEKFLPDDLAPLCPDSLVATTHEALFEFGRSHRKAVLKPLHQAQSKGIELLDFSTNAGLNDAEQKLRAATDNFQAPVLLQTYLAEIQKGETRLWLLNGKLLGALTKMPLKGDFRVNLDKGSQLAPASLDLKQKKSLKKISKFLRQHKIRLAAVDLIGHQISDFNITSPGLLCQLEALTKKNLARVIIKGLR